MHRLLKDLHPFRKNQIWLAVSGGIDSMVLLDIFAKAYQAGFILKPKVLHVNHHIHPDSDQWALRVQRVSEAYGLDIIVEDIEVDGVALEEQGRIRRYQAMLQHMKKEDLLLTAHHLDDQKETFLFRAFRGTGLRGLVGIRWIHQLYSHQVCRPLYQVPKSEIITYAKEHDLKWVEDPSNQDTQFRRNEIRKALSMIQNTEGFSLTQMHLQRQSEVLEKFLEKKLISILKAPHILSLDLFLKEDKDVQLELFHHWLSQFSESLSYHRTLAILDAMCSAKEDRYPQEKIGAYSLLRYREIITLLELPAINIDIQSSDEWIELQGIGRIHNPSQDQLHITLLGDNKGAYKKKLQNLNIPLWFRPYIPVINGQMILGLHYQWRIPKAWQYWFIEHKNIEAENSL